MFTQTKRSKTITKNRKKNLKYSERKRNTSRNIKEREEERN
jgi:hypothetical protein